MKLINNSDAAYLREAVRRGGPGMGSEIIEYGCLRFLSEGRLQLSYAIRDAKRLAEERRAPFIVGFTRQREILVAPMSERARFIDPLAIIITRHGSWSISDMNPRRFRSSGHTTDIPEWDTRMAPGYDDSKLVFALYTGFMDGTLLYGRFEADRRRCVPVLERAVKDCAKMAQGLGDKRGHVVLLDGTVSVERQWDLPDGTSVEVNPRDFLDGDVLLRDKVSDAARAAYEKFSKAAQSGRGAEGP